MSRDFSQFDEVPDIGAVNAEEHFVAGYSHIGSVKAGKRYKLSAFLAWVKAQIVGAANAANDTLAELANRIDNADTAISNLGDEIQGKVNLSDTTPFTQGLLATASPAQAQAALELRNTAPSVFYVCSTYGDNNTGEMGNPSKPYATPQVAFQQGLSLNEPFTIYLRKGNYAGIDMSGEVGWAMSNPCDVIGDGFSICKLGGFNCTRANGLIGVENDGQSAVSIPIVNFTSDGSVDFGSFTLVGGYGGQGGPEGGYNGGSGSSIDAFKLMGIRSLSSLTVVAGNGGDQSVSGGTGGAGGSIGASGVSFVFDCVFGAGSSAIYAGAGGNSGGTPGTVSGLRVTNSCFAGDLNIAADSDYIAKSTAGSLTISGTIFNVSNESGINNPTI